MAIQTFITCPLVALLVLFAATRGLEGKEQRVMLLAWVAHLAASFAMVMFAQSISAGGDMYWYVQYGRQIAKLLSYDVSYLPDVLRLILQMDHNLPVGVLLEGSATGSMCGLTGIVMFLAGDSVFAASIIFSCVAFWGSNLLYRAARWAFSPGERTAVLVGVVLVPSTVFWTSGIVKEGVVMAVLGLAAKSVVDALRDRSVVSSLTAAVGAYGIALIKPYLLFPLVLALGAALYSGKKKKSALYNVAALAVAIGGLFLVTRAFPEFGVERLGANLASSQRGFAVAGADSGSTLSFGTDADDDAPTSLVGQMKWAPLGLLNALFRPLPFDIRNAPTAIAALEMTAILAVVVMLLRRHNIRDIAAVVRADPLLRFAAVFILTFGTAVGLATTNLGTLSRYRVPMMPIYVGALLVLRPRMAALAAKRPASRRLPTLPKRESKGIKAA